MKNSNRFAVVAFLVIGAVLYAEAGWLDKINGKLEKAHKELQGVSENQQEVVPNTAPAVNQPKPISPERHSRASDKPARLFLIEFMKLEEEIKGMQRQIATQEPSLKRQDYFVPVKGDSRSIDVRGLEKESGLRVRGAFLSNGFRVPATEEKFVAWTNDMISVMQGDINRMKGVVASRDKLSSFYEEWEKLHREYVELCENFGEKRPALLMSAEMPKNCMRLMRKINDSNEFARMLARTFHHDFYEMLCPESEADTDRFIAETRTMYEQKMAPFRQKWARQEKCLRFCEEWEKLHTDYCQFLAEIGLAPKSLLRVEYTGDSVALHRIGTVYVSESFVALLNGPNHLDSSFLGVWPEDEATLDSFITGTRALYASSKDEYKQAFDEFSARSKALAEGLGTEGETQKAIAQLGHINPEMQREIAETYARLVGIQDDVKYHGTDYLVSKAKRAQLATAAEEAQQFKLRLDREISAWKTATEELRATVRSWRDEATWQALPVLFGLTLGATTYEIGQDVPMEVKSRTRAADSEARCRNETDWEVNNIFGLPGVSGHLYFASEDPSKGFVLIGYTCSVPQDQSYEQMIDRFASTLPPTHNKEVAREFVGYDYEELRRRNPWVAWQVEYYTSRAARLKEDGKVEKAARQQKMADELAEKNNAPKIMIGSTVFSFADCTVRIDSDVGEKHAVRMTVTDNLAISKLK